MSTQIWKFPLSAGHRNEVVMPRGAEILACQMQGETGLVPTLWAKVDTNALLHVRTFLTFGTGFDLTELDDVPNNYIGTVQAGFFVWHIFEII